MHSCTEAQHDEGHLYMIFPLQRAAPELGSYQFPPDQKGVLDAMKPRIRSWSTQTMVKKQHQRAAFRSYLMAREVSLVDPE